MAGRACQPGMTVTMGAVTAKRNKRQQSRAGMERKDGDGGVAWRREVDARWLVGVVGCIKLHGSAFGSWTSAASRLAPAGSGNGA